MGKHAQLVIGPAGSGKSTYCEIIQRHCQTMKRPTHVVNLDPAAETINYDCAIDIRSLISVSEVMEELDYGPNGALVYCMEYLVSNMSWLSDAVADYGDDYLLIDCPGQIELYSHLPVMSSITQQLQKWGYSVCSVYLIDSLLISDSSRFVAGTLMALSAMVALELPHVSILSKCDMVPNKKEMERFLEPDASILISELNQSAPPRFRALNEALTELLSLYSLVSFVPLDIRSSSSVEFALSMVDNAIQYGEDEEPKDPGDDDDGAVNEGEIDNLLERQFGVVDDHEHERGDE